MQALATPGELQAVLAQANFLAGCDVRVASAAPGSCELVLAYTPQLERPGGLISGMTMMGMADVAMWLAIMTLRGTAEIWVTTDMKTAFLKSGRREAITCRAAVLKPGSRTAYGTVDTLGEAAGLLAHHTVTYARVLES
jgi:uncharacterized protein (TIGR00369 family)